MRKLLTSMLALIIGLAFTTGTFAEMKSTVAETTPVEKKSTKIAQSGDSHDSKVVETKSASGKKEVKKERKSKKSKKKAATAQ